MDRALVVSNLLCAPFVNGERMRPSAHWRGSPRGTMPLRLRPEQRRRPPISFFLPTRLGGVGKLSTLGEHVRRGNPLKQPYSHEQNQQVVQRSDHRDEVRDELNGTEHITCAACCYQSRIPRRAGMFKHKIENMRFLLESLRPLLPTLRNYRFRSHHVGNRHRSELSVRVAIHHSLSYGSAHGATTGKSDSRGWLIQ